MAEATEAPAVAVETPEQTPEPKVEICEQAKEPEKVNVAPPPKKRARKPKVVETPTTSVDHSFFVGLLETQRSLERQNRLSRISNLHIV